ncbi:MAG: DUF502 domain-containing protein [Alphaproteobacteria bacterium]|nr:DUF502 domain-containing protein [Alphaproteobacteria bacterium]
MSDKNDLDENAGAPHAGRAPDRPRDLIKPQRQSFLGSIWSSFLAGIVVVAPIGITVAIVYWFVTGPMTRLDTFVKNFLPAGDSNVETITRAIPGFGVFIAILTIVFLGAFAKNFIGRTFIKFGEDLFDSVPVVRNLYRFFKNVFETALQQSDRSFKEVALVEYPRPGSWVMAFVVGETRGEVKELLGDAGERLTSVFIPTVPNPTSGFLLFVPRAALRPLTMTVEDAAKAVFSLGLVMPGTQPADDAVRKLEKAATRTSKQQKASRNIFGGRPEPAKEDSVLKR